MQTIPIPIVDIASAFTFAYTERRPCRIFALTTQHSLACLVSPYRRLYTLFSSGPAVLSPCTTLIIILRIPLLALLSPRHDDTINLTIMTLRAGKGTPKKDQIHACVNKVASTGFIILVNLTCIYILTSASCPCAGRDVGFSVPGSTTSPVNPLLLTRTIVVTIFTGIRCHASCRGCRCRR